MEMREIDLPPRVCRVLLWPDNDVRLLVEHSNNRVVFKNKLKDEVEEWITKHAPRTRHFGNMLGYTIDFADADLAFAFKIRWG
ncbi:MAG: hypothetical protein EOP83_00280 [Verrucomicrobiaceae bacterium]|nr:MAG: hypothetical protein EOP83_00280 [Verrucomicrobiaceae bacterium]